MRRSFGHPRQLARAAAKSSPPNASTAISAATPEIGEKVAISGGFDQVLTQPQPPRARLRQSTLQPYRAIGVTRMPTRSHRPNAVRPRARGADPPAPSASIAVDRDRSLPPQMTAVRSG